jgi:hypothetical protein
MWGTTTSFNFRVNCARNFIARKKLWRTTIVVWIGVPAIGFLFSICVLLSKYWWNVVEHEAATIGVTKYSTITTNRFGNQDAFNAKWPNHAGWMELDEFHVH